MLILNATKDKFFSILAHDLKNPIFGMSSLIEIIANDVVKDNSIDLAYNLDLLKTNSKHVSKLLESLLTWARSQRGLISYNPMDINVGYVCKSSLELFQTNLLNKSISIIDNSDESLTVYADPNMFITIFRNLFSNAIKFTPNSGTIKIDTVLKNKFVQLSIQDTGVGMNSEILEGLFSIDKSTHRLGTNNETGTGLGLILCKEFVEKNNGKIWAESTLNQGSTFYFTLPIQ